MPTNRPIQDETAVALLDEDAMRTSLEECNKAHPDRRIQFEFRDGVLHLGTGQKQIVLTSDQILAYKGDIVTHARLWTEKKERSNHAPMIVSGGNISLNDTAHGLGSERLKIQAEGTVSLNNRSYMGAVAGLLVHDIDITAEKIVIDRVNVRDAKLDAPVVETADEKGRIDVRPNFTNVAIGRTDGTVNLAGSCHDCVIMANNGSVYQADYRTRTAAPVGFNCGFDPHQQQSGQRQQVTNSGRSSGSGIA